jgi:hypothetical protein
MNPLPALYSFPRNLCCTKKCVNISPVPGDKTVKVITVPNSQYYENADRETEALSRTQKRWIAVLFISGATGFLSGLSGIALMALSLFGVSDRLSGLGHIGGWLFAAFLWLLVVAAHAIDKADQAEKAIRLNYCRMHGLKEDCPNGQA